MKLRREAISLLGNTIREERKIRGLTQKQLGEFAGTGINFISALEKGKVTIRIDKLLDVLSVLGLQLKIEYGKEEITK